MRAKVSTLIANTESKAAQKKKAAADAPHLGLNFVEMVAGLGVDAAIAAVAKAQQDEANAHAKTESTAAAAAEAVARSKHKEPCVYTIDKTNVQRSLSRLLENAQSSLETASQDLVTATELIHKLQELRQPDECAICNATLEHGDDCAQLPCDHSTFHWQCADGAANIGQWVHQLFVVNRELGTVTAVVNGAIEVVGGRRTAG